ncbi:MAG: family 43 glycosylhydrolase [Opitutales bacterium]|nr:family 43 glycosylhydrolase [Opitutales bacterium]
MKLNKKITTLLLTAFAFYGAVAQNPLKVGDKSFYGADPSGLFTSDGKLYMVVTTDEIDWDDQVDWNIFSSEDGVNWKDHGVIFAAEDSGWGKNNAWAPDITEKDGKFYLYYYFRNSGPDGGVGVAVADHPEGPYKEAIGERLLKGHDPAIFNDDDGQSYLFIQDKAYILGDDMVSVKEGPINLNLEYRPKKFEAAYVIKNNDTYYFTIARDWNNLIYYTAKSVLGPYTFQGEFMKPYGGNNHHSILNINGQWIIFYHQWVKGVEGHEGHARRIRAEYLNFAEDGSIKLISPSEEGITLDL